MRDFAGAFWRCAVCTCSHSSPRSYDVFSRRRRRRPDHRVHRSKGVNGDLTVRLWTLNVCHLYHADSGGGGGSGGDTSDGFARAVPLL